jgi:hypothetical protein
MSILIFNVVLIDYIFYPYHIHIRVFVSLAQLVATMHNICKVWVQNPTTTKKNTHICNMIIMKYIRWQNKIKLEKTTKKNKSNIFF